METMFFVDTAKALFPDAKNVRSQFRFVKMV